MAKKVDYKKYNCVLEMSKWMGSTPKAFKAAILKEAVRQNANSGGKVEKKEIRACRAEKHKKRTCKEKYGGGERYDDNYL